MLFMTGLAQRNQISRAVTALFGAGADVVNGQHLVARLAFARLANMLVAPEHIPAHILKAVLLAALIAVPGYFWIDQFMRVKVANLKRPVGHRHKTCY
jgi:hypothetical protein